MPSGKFILWSALVAAGVYFGMQKYAASKGA